MNDLKTVIEIIKAKKVEINLTEGQKCQLCLFILNNPFQTDCGCLFCEPCINSWLQTNQNCPGNSDDCNGMVLKLNKSIREDKGRAKEISKIKIKCIFQLCEVTMELRRLGEHMKECLFRTAVCRGCNDEVCNRDMNTHRTKECTEREVKCTHCNGRMTSKMLINEHNNQTHENICAKYKGKCPYNCGVEESVFILNHRELCVNRPLRCAFTVCGCTKDNLMKQELIDHHREYLLTHCVLLVQVMEKKNTKLVQLKSTLLELENEVGKLTNHISALENNNKMLNYYVVRENEDDLLRDGEFLWKIDNFFTLKDNAKTGTEKSIRSEPFYSSEFGYKMCLKIYPYGDGIGRGTHLSVFFVIMMGDYDDILQWPFQQRIKLSIVPHGGDSIDAHTDVFMPNGTLPCYQKPKEEYNGGSGSPLFITQEHLVKKFIKNDIFFIKATVLNEGK